jgi:hypothetical protein
MLALGVTNPDATLTIFRRSFSRLSFPAGFGKYSLWNKKLCTAKQLLFARYRDLRKLPLLGFKGLINR